MDALSRGDESLKIDSWPQAIVAVAGILATGGVVVFLASAGWSGEAIGAFASLALGIIASQFVSARKAAVVEAKTDQQTATLATIKAQTNGMADAERKQLAEDTAAAVIRRMTGGTGQ